MDHVMKNDVSKRCRVFVDAQLTVVCCEEGRAIVYVGVHTAGDFTSRFSPAPKGAVRLDDEVVEAGMQFERALESAVRRGQGQEDTTQGHSLAIDPDTRTRAAFPRHREQRRQEHV